MFFKSEIIAWFQTLNISNGPADRGMDGFAEWLKSGHILCALMNQLAPGSVRKINQTANVKMAVRLLKFTNTVNHFHLLGTTNEQRVRKHFLLPVGLYRLWHRQKWFIPGKNSDAIMPLMDRGDRIRHVTRIIRTYPTNVNKLYRQVQITLTYLLSLSIDRTIFNFN